MNQNIVDQLAERIVNETNSAISCLTLYLGHKLDLFNSLRKEGPITSEELSKKTTTGAAMTPSTFKKYAKEAGFSKIEILPIEHFIWQFYRLTK